MDISCIPQEQFDRVFAYDMCDIDYEFLGFTEIYEHLAAIVPAHWTIVDLGCAFAPQAWLFRDHKAYVGVDLNTPVRFSAPNTKHYEISIEDFVKEHAADFDQHTTFAICSYVPPWHGDNMKIARNNFKNVFTYYPAGGRSPIIRLGKQ